MLSCVVGQINASSHAGDCLTSALPCLQNYFPLNYEASEAVNGDSKVPCEAAIS